jgi:hypothetical protein
MLRAMGLIDPELERLEDGEEERIARVIATVEGIIRDKYSDPNGPALRDAHPKQHGAVKGELRVHADVPDELKHGLFASESTYKTWIRFSNGASKPAPDKSGDGRGIAIKVFGVEGERVQGGIEQHTQDFVFIDHPVFFIKNVAQYVAFTELDRQGKAMKFFFSWNPCKWHIGQALIVRRTQRTIASMLENDYFSMSPYKLGPLAVKLRARSVGPRDAEVPADPSDDFLRDNMREHLAEREAVFEIQVQPRTTSSMEIEDATCLWKERDSQFITVATLTIPSQTFDSPEQMQFAENLSFNPWHSLVAHAPLGGLNRMRRAVYTAISNLRHQMNSAPQNEPTGDETF